MKQRSPIGAGNQPDCARVFNHLTRQIFHLKNDIIQNGARQMISDLLLRFKIN